MTHNIQSKSLTLFTPFADAAEYASSVTSDDSTPPYSSVLSESTPSAASYDSQVAYEVCVTFDGDSNFEPCTYPN